MRKKGYSDKEIKDFGDNLKESSEQRRKELLAKLNRSKGDKTPMECQECGNKFSKKLGKNTTEVKCPKCGSYDTDVG